MEIKTFFDKATFTLTYVAFDPSSRDAVIVDPVLNYDPAGSAITTSSTEELVGFIKSNELKVHYILETHAHADHLSSSQQLKDQLGAKVVIGERITDVQEVFKELYNFGDEFKVDGSQFDKLVKDDEVFEAGTLKIKALATPGHTPACVTFQVNEKWAFTGDAIFMPDFGVGRCDFPSGSAEDLYDSVTSKIYTLPDDTKLYTGHDYQPGGRPLKWESTVAEQKKDNIQLKGDTSREGFVKYRTDRDATLSAPRLLLQSVQYNINAGNFRETENNGKHYLKMPVFE